MIEPTLFEFLTDLQANNQRAWFEANKSRYETVVRQPLMQFVSDFALRLPQISPHFEANQRSLFRIQRDIRFSKDKTPYKTAAALQFRHRVGKDVHAPGFYLHLEPGQTFIGGGIWQPDTSALSLIRQAISEKADLWVEAVQHLTDHGLALEGASLKNPPKGFATDHPLMADLKRKDFVFIAPLTLEVIYAPDFVDYTTEVYQQAAPFMRFLTQALGLAW